MFVIVVFNLKMSRGPFTVVEYKEGTTFTEIVNVERTRLINTQPPIDKNTFFKCEVEVPLDVRE